MNRISVLVAAGALGAVALTAGCSSSSAKGAGNGGSTSGSTAGTSSASSSAPGGNPGSGSASTTTSAPAGSSATGSSTAPTTASSAPTTTAQNSGACTTAEMPSGTWRVVPDSQGAGHVAADIALQNTSGHTCTVSGYPGVALLASNDHPLPTNVVKDASEPVTTVKVAPGAWVHAEVRYSPNVPGPGESQSGQCEPTTVHALAQLPGDTAWGHITLDNPTPVCEKGELQAKPFVGGKSSPAGG